MFWYLFLCIYSTVWFSPPVTPGPLFSAGPQETTFSKYHTKQQQTAYFAFHVGFSFTF